MSETPASEKTSDEILKELQSWWKIPSICVFVELFKRFFRLPELDVEDLEQYLLEDSVEKPCKSLSDLLLAFLKSIMPGKVNSENWETQLQKLVQRKWPDGEEVPFPEGKSFRELSRSSKVDILHSLCYYRIDKSDTPEVMKQLIPDSLRVQKLGTDREGNAYWYFFGTRLYKEEIPKEKPWEEEWVDQKEKSLKKRGRGRPRKIKPAVNQTASGEKEEFVGGYFASEKSRWSVVCETMEHWVDFAEKFKNSGDKNEKAMFKYLQALFLPKLTEIFAQKEQRLRQKLKELMPAFPIREKIITRRETRKLRGETFESPGLNGFTSDEPHRMHLIRDRARRLEERNKRASDGDIIQIPKRSKRTYTSMREDFSFAESEEDNNVPPSPPSLERMRIPVTEAEKKVQKLLSDVKLHKDAWPFLHPVDNNEVPGYRDIVKEPIDLTTIESKLYDHYYETLEDVNADFSRLVSNCKLFNGEHHVFSKMADNLWKVYQEGLKTIINTFEPAEDEHDDASGCSSGDSSDASDPHTLNQIVNKAGGSKKHKSKKKKKISGMEALEMLAQASQLAVQSTNAQDTITNSSMNDQQKGSSDFPSLKIVPIHNHPQELIDKFSSESSNESMGENLEYLNRDYPNTRTNSSRESPPVEEDPVHYMNNTFSQLTNLIEKNNAQSLNFFSSNDISSVLSESAPSPTGSRHVSPVHEPDVAAQNNNFGHDILDEGENVSNIFSQMIQQPVYNHTHQAITQNKDGNASYTATSPKPNTSIRSPQNSVGHAFYTETSLKQNSESRSPQNSLGRASCIETSTKQDANNRSPQNSLKKNTNIRSPQNSVAHVVTDNPPVTQESPDKNTSTIEASVVGIPSYPGLPKLSPGQHGGNKESPDPETVLNIQVSPNAVKNINQYNASPNSVNYDPSVTVPNIGYFESLNGINTNPTTRANSVPDIPLQIPASFSKLSPKSPVDPDLPLQGPQQSKIQMDTLDNFLRVRMPAGSSQLVVVTEPSSAGVTLHVYSKSKMDQDFVSETITVPNKQSTVEQSLVNVSGSIPSILPVTIPFAVPGCDVSAKPQMFSNSQELTTVNKENRSRSSPTQKKSPIPPSLHSVTHHVPSRSLPYANTSSSIPNVSRMSLPVTSSNFVPVNSQNVNRNNLSLRTKGLESGPARMSLESTASTFGVVSTSYNGSSGVLQSYNNVYQTVPKNPPVVFSGAYNQVLTHQNDARFQNNPGTVLTTQSGLSVPVMQQVLIPTTSQQARAPNKGQIIFQNSVNGVLNQNQNQNIQQIHQGFAKGVPQMISSTPVVTVSKDVMQSLQLPVVTQTQNQIFTQGVPGQQYIGVPSYVFANQNVIPTASQPVINYQPFQTTQTRPMKGSANT